MRGSSVHFKRIASALHAVSHASREASPEYLLPADFSMGTHVVIDDYGQVQKMLDHKMSLASRQAKATKGYSPIWEGVINLPEPSPEVTPERQISIVQQWCKEYEAITGHKVLRADVHLDEGYIDTSGKPQFNAHAHVMCDRTDEKGKVKKLRSTVLRELQDMTAKVTTLQRGIDAQETKRRHIGHHHYRFDAEKNRLDLEKPIAELARLQKLSKEWSDTDLAEIRGLKEKLVEAQQQAAQQAQELAQLKAQYQQDRQALKASGEATQRDYQALKAKHEAALAELIKSQAAATTLQTSLDGEPRRLQAAITAQKAQLDKEYQRDREALKASSEATQRDYQQLKQQHEAALAKLATAQTEAGKVPELVAQVNALKPKADRVPDLERDLAKARQEAINTKLTADERYKNLHGQALAIQAERNELAAKVEALRIAPPAQTPAPRPTPAPTVQAPAQAVPHPDTAPAYVWPKLTEEQFQALPTRQLGDRVIAAARDVLVMCADLADAAAKHKLFPRQVVRALESLLENYREPAKPVPEQQPLAAAPARTPHSRGGLGR
jgi:predicted  nucleic acid-binding Zn-ribbon protein